jgi:phytoene dehydrogenase-like protein
LIVYARVVAGYLQGSYYPCGGGSAITERLAGVIREHGGEVELGTEVSNILVTDGAVRGVRVRSASLDAAAEPTRDIVAPVVVSAMDIKATFFDLLPAEAVSSTLLRRVRGYEMPLPLFVVYLVVDRDLRAEGHPNTNTFVFGGDDAEAAYAGVQAGAVPAEMGAGISYANLADPDNPRLCRPGQTNLQVITIDTARHDAWGASPGAGRTARYEARVKEMRDRLVALADQDIPGIASSIAFETTATPIAEERYMRCTGGTSYGIAATPRQSMLGRPGPKTPIRGLFLAGASTRTGHGLVGTLAGGAAAAAAVIGIPMAELVAPTPGGAAAAPAA